MISKRPLAPIDQLKRSARQLRKAHGLQHARALDRASVEMGFQNYINAHRSLASAHVAALPATGFPMTVTVPWRDFETHATGMETQTITLSRPLDAIVSSAQFRRAPRLGHLRQRAGARLVDRDLAISQGHARRECCQALRTLQFMDATGLQPSLSRVRAYPQGDRDRSIPGQDHATVWFDPVTKAYIIADEPYGLSEAREVQRSDWAQRYGFAVLMPRWRGMYYPDGGTELYLISSVSRGFDLSRAVQMLDRLGRPPSSEFWTGLSEALDWSEFR